MSASDEYELEMFLADLNLETLDDGWDGNESSFKWIAQRTWFSWSDLDPAEYSGSKRVYMEKAGPTMRPHP